MYAIRSYYARPESVDGKHFLPIEQYGVECMSLGFMVDPASPVIWRGPMVSSAIEQLLGDASWGDIDVMVIDLPPGTGDAQLMMSQKVPLDGAIIVSTPQDIALLDAIKGLNMFHKVGTDIIGVIENMSYFVCPSCGTRVITSYSIHYTKLYDICKIPVREDQGFFCAIAQG